MFNYIDKYRLFLINFSNNFNICYSSYLNGLHNIFILTKFNKITLKNCLKMFQKYCLIIKLTLTKNTRYFLRNRMQRIVENLGKVLDFFFRIYNYSNVPFNQPEQKSNETPRKLRKKIILRAWKRHSSASSIDKRHFFFSSFYIIAELYTWTFHLVIKVICQIIAKSNESIKTNKYL